MISSWALESVTVTRYLPVATLRMSTDFVAGNIMALSIGSTPLSVTFATTHADMMAALAAALAGAPGVTSALVSQDALSINILPVGLAISDLSVTAGASQPALTLSGGWFNGTYVPAIPTTLTTQASVQPVTGSELMRFPEGERTKGMFKLYTVTELFSADEALGIKADQITRLGKTYEITQVLPYVMPPRSSYFKAIAVRLDARPGL